MQIGPSQIKSRRVDSGTGHLWRVALPLSVQEKLRIKFRKSVRKGYAKNLEMDPVIPDAITLIAEPEEAFIVRVDSTRGPHYWFSDVRLLREHDQGIDELLRYESVSKARARPSILASHSLLLVDHAFLRAPNTAVGFRCESTILRPPIAPLGAMAPDQLRREPQTRPTGRGVVVTALVNLRCKQSDQVGTHPPHRKQGPCGIEVNPGPAE